MKNCQNQPTVGQTVSNESSRDLIRSTTLRLAFLEGNTVHPIIVRKSFLGKRWELVARNVPITMNARMSANLKLPGLRASASALLVNQEVTAIDSHDVTYG